MEDKRKELPDEKGYKTIKEYEWTLEKIKNKKQLSGKTEALDRVIEMAEGDGDSLLDILNDDSVISSGHYKIDPVKEVEKKVMVDELKRQIDFEFKRETDRQIIIRSYGLFVEENSPQEVRNRVQGQTPGEIAIELNKIESSMGSLKRWTSNSVQEREVHLLKRLRSSPEFAKAMTEFLKSEGNGKNLAGLSLLIYYMVIYDVIEKSLAEAFPYLNEVSIEPYVPATVGNGAGKEAGTISQETTTLYIGEEE